VIPVALNSGLYWGKDAFTKRSGTIIIEFLPPIPPGLGKAEFMKRLQEAIETASQRLLEEGKSHGS
jgi:1-acyl-sn-glycerol-3-phosphate acyltransferase